MSALNWYQALAMWKAAVFMEGNYKRFSMGASDDHYLALFDEGVPALAEKARRSPTPAERPAGGCVALDAGQLLQQGLQPQDRLVHLREPAFEALGGVVQVGELLVERLEPDVQGANLLAQLADVAESSSSARGRPTAAP